MPTHLAPHRTSQCGFTVRPSAPTPALSTNHAVNTCKFGQSPRVRADIVLESTHAELISTVSSNGQYPLTKRAALSQPWEVCYDYLQHAIMRLPAL